MKVSSNTVLDIMSGIRPTFQRIGAYNTGQKEAPFRSELYSSDQMDRHGKILAQSHTLLQKTSPDILLKRLGDNDKTLLDVRNLLVERIKTGKTISPGAEWLLDNFYLIEEQVVIARKHLPKGYSEDLPYLADGNSAKMPRVYDIVLEIISHSDGRVDIKGLTSFIAAYQTHTILTLGELWAIPIMLRLAVIENLRRVSAEIALDMIDDTLADYWAERMITTLKEEPGDLILTIADMAREKPVLQSSFVAGFTRRLQGEGPSLALPLSWMEQQLTRMGTSSSELVLQENQKQAANQVSVRNSIGTLRLLGSTDWKEFVETLSRVDQILRKDPAGIYSYMDFSTRDRYRHVVEAISKASSLAEFEVAEKVIGLAEKAVELDQKPLKKQHIGYYLIDKGLKQSEVAAGMRASLKQNVVKSAGRNTVFLYLISVIIITLAFAAGMWYMAYRFGNLPDWMLVVVALLSISGSAQLGVSFVNWLSTVIVQPELLPRMDYCKGIPPENRTLVVIPTLLSSKPYIEELVEALEIRFLANKEDHLHYGLLTDFMDAESEIMPEDQGLLESVVSKIEDLNQKYERHGDEIFFLFHRPRTWNPKEKKWMGYERKRGKLSALNSLLRDVGKDEFSMVTGNQRLLTNVKYVITLDSDTQLPRDSAWKLIGTMAHPLNQPIYSSEKKRVTEGYGILQPRVAASLPKKSTSTLYLRLYGNLTGIDPYTKVSSDVYQDLFGEGSFIGKGIYDVDIFEKSVKDKFQDNRILSHDLLEGVYARAGLLSDVLLYEENPSKYGSDVRRRHRWIRGDWQIGAWMLPFVSNPQGRLTKNPLSTLSRWKIMDNLRRSFLPVSLILLLLLGWSILPFPWFWTSTVTIIILFAVMAAAGWQLIHKPKDLDFRSHLTEVGRSVQSIIFQFIFGIAILPYEAYNNIDAVLRTNWRMIISGKKLLEWTPSATASSDYQNNILSTYREMWIGPLLSTACVFYFLATDLGAFLVASPMLILWFLAPALAWKLSIPESEKDIILPDEQTLFLHKTARKTWSFFEQFVNAEENFLPPDNFQEHPVEVIAHRTSPTNIGLALLANLSAYDFGYISSKALLNRCDQTISTMLKMDRYKGHFYNWYDTLSLDTLRPRYVSTVDSGNLAGHLLTLRQGLLGIKGHPVFSVRNFEGLRTTVSILQDVYQENPDPRIEKIAVKLDQAIEEDSRFLSKVKQQLDELLILSQELLEGTSKNVFGSYQWKTRFHHQLKNIIEDLTQLVPWLDLLNDPEASRQFEMLDHIPSLREIKQLHDRFLLMVSEEHVGKQLQNKDWFNRIETSLKAGGTQANEKILNFEQLAEHCDTLCDISYEFLFDKTNSLLRIGYNVEDERKDDGYYDLLASEARLGIFVAIAQGKLPQESWFALGRLLTDSGGSPILISWSGSMFEYLMPQLVMPAFENTLLYQTNKSTVKRQIEYAKLRGVPWGISESGYNRVDANMNYQYRAFGVPGLGLKRGLEEDLVIAPYASMLALMVSPQKATSNLQLLSKEGFEGEFGFYEAIDYNKSRQARGFDHTVVQSYMVHHQGMGLLSLAYILLNKPMQERFLSELRFQATLLLLQERIPRATLFYAHMDDLPETQIAPKEVNLRVINKSNTRIPEIQLLSNGRYQVMVTNSGGGYSRWKGIALTRWREDTTKDDKGIFCYIKDVESGQFWSNTHHPTMVTAIDYQVVFSQGNVEFRRQDAGIETKTEIVVSPEDDTEMRRVKVMNRTKSVKVLEVTSYAEVVMATQASDEAHPAFSNLFVQTEIIPEYRSILCTRRPRSEEDNPPWMFHLMEAHGAKVEDVSFETDRLEFIGRGKTIASPQAMSIDALSGKDGAVLDPVLSIRYRISVKPGQTAVIDLIYGINETREGCENLMHKYRDIHLKKRAFELSWTHSQVLLRQINASEGDAQLYDRLAASLIYANPGMRAQATVIESNFRGQSGLWSHSVSGDIPILLLHIHDPESVDLVKQLVKAHAYWRLKGLAVDLVIWNEDYGSYRQELQEQIQGLISTELASNTVYGKPGSIFVKSADQISPEDRSLFGSVARIIIHDNKGTLAEQVNRHYEDGIMPKLLQRNPRAADPIQLETILQDDLLFFNGFGGFTADGLAYKIVTEKNKSTPAPWSNILANPDFGSVVSESGSAYSWAINAHEYRITPWNNDPICDIGGEAFYLRDEETGTFWSPMPFPAKGNSRYITTHGFGYSSFDHIESGIESHVVTFVDKDSPIKFIVLELKNRSGRERKISAAGFIELILGDVRSKTNMHVISRYDQDTGALLFTNRYNSAFGDRVTFFKVDGANLSYTTDRTEFIGRNRSLKDPAALYRTKLSGKSGAGMDTCAALQVKFDLLDGEEKIIVFRMGNEENIQKTQALIRKFGTIDDVWNSLIQVQQYWKEVLGAVQVETPNQSLNILANGWLMYQTIACRIFARSGFYQSGGAFGFRDQLQDVLAVLNTQPDLTRNQILLSASRQFVEGDVQHWWHPPEGRGVRTRCSDDMLWLPFVVSRYIAATGDKDILNETVGFLESRPLYQEEESFYDLPASGNFSASLYEHCVRAIKHSLHFGEHGLPFIGSGDWNDGMDRVGIKGKGESVWLGFFLYDVLERFNPVAIEYGDRQFADDCKKAAHRLQLNLEDGGWDREWYRRAYFDDGSPLGSKENEECRIDAIAQSWSVLSGAGSKERQLRAMDSLNQNLVRRDLNLIQLLDPPFNEKGPNPGYIRGYVPGVRENGGQYSHAAIWTLMAFAQLKDREKVWELFTMIQPINHASDSGKSQVYKVEPYVMAADVYANISHKGRGGWTWYTGSSGWMYQFITNSLIGLNLQKDHLQFNPCFPLDWPSVTVHYRFGQSTYKITVFQVIWEGDSWWEIGDIQGEGNRIPLTDDGQHHDAQVHVHV